MAVSGVSLAAVAVGSVFVYAGIKGTSVLASFQDIVQGHPPRMLQIHPINLPPDAVAGGQAAAGGASAGANAGGGGTVRPTPGLGNISPKGAGGGGGGGNILPNIPEVAPPAQPIIPQGSPPPKPKWWPF